MEFQGKFEWIDYLDAQLLHMQRPVVIRVMLYVFYVLIGLAVVAGLWLSITGRFPFEYLLPMLVIGAVAILYRFVYLPWQARRIFTQTKELALPMNFEITEDGLKITNEWGGGLRPWKTITKWREGKDLLLLYASDAVFIMIPKRFFTDPAQLEGIKSHLVQNKVSAAGFKFQWIVMIVYFIIIIAVGVITYINAVNGGK